MFGFVRLKKRGEIIIISELRRVLVTYRVGHHAVDLRTYENNFLITN